MTPIPLLNRRTFLRSAAVAAAAPLLLPSRSPGRDALSRTLHVGIIGAGTRFRSHLASFSAIADVRVVAVCDIWRQRAEQAKSEVDKRNGDTACRVFHDFRELIAESGVEIVTVAAPDHWHALMAVEAARKGKHIYLEKPFAYSVEEGRAIVREVQHNGVILQHGTQQRSSVWFQRATYLARHGFLGNLRKAYAISPTGPAGGDPLQTELPEGYDYEFFTGPAPRTPFYRDLALRPGTPGWYFTSVFGGGWVTAWGSHHLDSAQFALGKDHEAPVKMEAQGSFPAAGVFDTPHSWHAEFTYAGGQKLIYCTVDRPECPQIQRNIVLVGDEGWVAASRAGISSSPASLVERAWPRTDPDLQILDRGGESDHFANFVDAIRNGSIQNGRMEPGHLSTTLCHLTRIGIELQRPLRWDAKTEQFAGDAAANRLLGRSMRAPWKLA